MRRQTQEINGGRTYATGKTRYYYVTVLYPASQFKPDTKYTFENNVRFTATEVDNGKVSFKEAKATVVWSYRDPVWHDPTGHYNIFKNGNDGKPQKNVTHHIKSNNTFSDLHLRKNEYYGIYGSALNDLQEGNDVEVSYTINTIGYIMPWTYKEVYPGTYHYDDEGKLVWDIPPARIIGNYYQRPVTMVSSEEGLSLEDRHGDPLVWGTDYVFTSVEILDPYLFYGKPENINEDGSWMAKTWDDGTFVYTRDVDLQHYPDMELEIYRKGEWELLGTANWDE